LLRLFPEYNLSSNSEESDSSEVSNSEEEEEAESGSYLEHKTRIGEKRKRTPEKRHEHSNNSRQKRRRTKSSREAVEDERQRKPANFWTAEESKALMDLVKGTEKPKGWNKTAMKLNARTGGTKTASQCCMFCDFCLHMFSSKAW